MGRKKVCFFSSNGRESHEVLIYRQAKSLQDNGYETIFYVADDLGESMINGVRVKSLGATRKNYFYRIFILPWKVFSTLYRENANVYQTSALEFLIVCLFLKIKKKSVFFHLREAHPYSFYDKVKCNHFIAQVIVFFMTVYMRFVFKLINGIFVVAQDQVDYLKRWKINNYYLLGNYPIINEHFSLTFDEYLKRSNTIIYFGSIYEISRQEVFFDALSKHPEANYYLAGVFCDERYQNQLVSHPYWQNVFFINGFSVEELPILLSQAIASNVLRDFSQIKACPNGSLGIIKLFESMEAGLPIICSDVPVYREMMEDYHCGLLVDPNDVNQVEGAIHYILSNKEAAWKMGQEGRRAVIEKYSWNAASKLYISVIENSCRR